MWHKIVANQIKKYSQTFIVERQIEMTREESNEHAQARSPSSTGFLDFSNVEPTTNLNVTPTQSKEHFSLTGVKLNSKDKLNFSEVGASAEASVRLMLLKSSSDNLPLLVRDIIFEGGAIEAGDVKGGVRYIIKRVLKTLKYQRTELLSYEIEEARA